MAPMTVTGSWGMGVMGSFVLTVDRLPPWAVLRADADDPQRRIRGDLGRPGHTAGTVVATRRFAPRNEAYPLRTDTLVSIREPVMR